MLLLLIVLLINIVNRKLYTWGTGHAGEIGVEKFSNVPLQFDLDDIYVDKVQCGKNFTAVIDCNKFLI
jgi:hypothetical protein